MAEARGASGEHRTSNWQTLMALMHPTPQKVSAGDQFSLHFAIDLSTRKILPQKYSVHAKRIAATNAPEQPGSLMGIER